MGILRADRVSGLGGANAINGSVFFGSTWTESSTALKVASHSDLNIGSGNFTIEYWFYSDTDDAWGTSVASWEYNAASSLNGFTIYHTDLGIKIYNRTGGGYSNWYTGTSGWSLNTWHHFAWVREGTGSNENKIYIDGTLLGSAATNAVAYTDDQPWSIGGNNLETGTYPRYGYSGYLSNVRISNVARYTANFTAPTTRFEKDANTILLACQSPGDVTQEATGKILTPSVRYTSNKPPVASHFAPDVGEDHGTTFADNTRFNTLSYMVPPGGTTAESNRGRGLFMGGYTSSPSGAALNVIYGVEIQSQGIGFDFGDLAKGACWGGGAGASSTRGLHAGGTTPTNLNSIDYVTIATTANALDFGDLTSLRGFTQACSNNTRALIGGGRAGSPAASIDSVDYVTIATTGNASDFGDLTVARQGGSALASVTRGLIIGGANAPSAPTTYFASIDRFTIATTGNAADYGDLSSGGRGYMGCASSATRGVIGGGLIHPNRVNNIDYITIATDGNSTDFGDLLDDREHTGATSNSLRAIWAGGVSPYRNSIEYVTIATTGNAQDFGDVPDPNGSYAYASAATSDSHGGIS